MRVGAQSLFGHGRDPVMGLWACERLHGRDPRGESLRELGSGGQASRLSCRRGHHRLRFRSRCHAPIRRDFLQPAAAISQVPDMRPSRRWRPLTDAWARVGRDSIIGLHPTAFLPLAAGLDHPKTVGCTLFVPTSHRSGSRLPWRSSHCREDSAPSTALLVGAHHEARWLSRSSQRASSCFSVIDTPPSGGRWRPSPPGEGLITPMKVAGSQSTTPAALPPCHQDRQGPASRPPIGTGLPESACPGGRN